MTNDNLDPLALAGQAQLGAGTFGGVPAASDSFHAFDQAKPVDFSGETPISVDSGAYDPLAVKFGSTRDPLQLDMDPFGRNTVKWGKARGEEYAPDYVLSANIFGRVMSRETLQKTDKGRKLIKIMEDNRNGRKRGFLDALFDVSKTDLPFMGMFAAVDGNLSDATVVHNTLDKIQKGESISEDEALATRLYIAEQERKATNTWGATVGDIVRAAPGFMTEFAVSSWGLGKLMSVVGKAASGSAGAAARLSIDRFTKVTAKGLVEDGFTKAFTASKSANPAAAIRSGWESLRGYASATGDTAKLVSKVRTDAVTALTPLVQTQLNTTASMAAKVAGARIDLEIGAAVARNSPSLAVTRWAKGTYQAAVDHFSRGLLDFGTRGTDVYSASSAELGSAMKTLGRAIGILGPEAMARGAMISVPAQGIVKPLIGAVTGSDVVSAHQLDLETRAVKTGNRELFDSAEAYSMGLTFLEYASENSGAGFGKLFRAAGLGILGSKALGVPTGTSGLLPQGVAEAAGSSMRRWITKAIGTTDDFVRGHAKAQARAVTAKLGDDVPAEAVDAFVSTGDAAALGAFAERLGGVNPRKFINQAVQDAIKSNQLDMAYRGMLRYTIADKMIRMGWGPDQTTHWLKQAGYDGIIEEMLEERYSDFAKGLFGWDDRKAEDKGFGANIRQAFSNLKVSWEQLTAEAVGFAVPIGVRAAVNTVQRAASDTDLAFAQRYASTIREFRGTNNIVESSADTYFRVAQSEIDSLKTQLGSKEEGTGLYADFAREDARTDLPEAEKARRTGEIQTRINDLTRRISVAESQTQRQRTALEAADVNAKGILAFEATNTSGKTTGGETPSPTQARRGVAAKDVIVEGAARAGEALARARANAVDPRNLSLGQRFTHRISGVLGAILTGDLSLAAYDPMSWTMVDHGLDRQLVTRLADAYDAHFESTRARLLSSEKRTVTDEEVREKMRAGYEAETKSIAQSYLAAQGIRVFSRREMLDQARNIVMDKYGTLTGHQDEVESTREQIAEYTLRILSGGALQTTDDIGRIARGIINISDDSPFADDKILDSALRLSGFRGLEQTIELRPETDLRQAIGAKSLDADAVARIASYKLEELTDEQQSDIVAAAVRLGYRPNSDATGKNTMAYTEEAISHLNARVQRLCRLAQASASPYIRNYVRPASFTEFGEATRLASDEHIRVVRDGKGYHWTETTPDGERTLTLQTQAEVDQYMTERGFKASSTPVTFVMAREIRSKDPAVMLEKLGLTSRYISMQTAGKSRDALAESASYVHPAFRERLDDEGNPVRLTMDEAHRIFVEELTLAERFRDVMSLSESARIDAFRTSEDQTEAEILSELNLAENMYKAVFGSEQNMDGYLPRLESLLRTHGVELPGAQSRSYSRYLAGQTDWYVLNTRLLNYHEGEAFVLVDLNRDTDYDGAIMSRAITNGLSAFRDLWAYDPASRTYPAFSSTLRDMMRRTHRVAVDLARESNNSGRPGEARAMMRVIEKVLGGSNVDFPKPEAITWLVRNAVLGQVMREASASRSTTPDAAAEARLAEAVRQTPEFWPFFGFADIILGGNGFAAGNTGNRYGIAAIAAAFSGNPKYAIDDLLKNGVLPVLSDGRRMDVTRFLTLVNRSIESRTKAGVQVDEAKAAQEAEQDVMSFVGSIMRTAKLRTAKDLKDFMASVLANAGLRAGNTEDLRGWKSVVETTKLMRATLAAEHTALRQTVTELRAELDNLLEQKANGETAHNGRGIADEIQAAQERLDSAIAAERAMAREETAPEPGEDAHESVKDELEASPAEEVKAESTEESAPEESDDSYEFFDEDGNEIMPDDLAISSVPVEAGSSAPEMAETTDSNGSLVSGVQMPEPLSMSEDARRFAMRTILAAFTGEAIPTVKDVRIRKFDETAKMLFPSMSSADRSEIINLYEAIIADVERTGAASAEDAARAADEDVLAKMIEVLNDEGTETSDSEGFNEKAVSTYNSLRPLLEMMETSVPITKRNFQGLVNALRDDVIRRCDPLAEEDHSDQANAYRLADMLLNPRRQSVGTTYAQRLALHHATMSKVFNADESSDTSVLDRLIRVFSARVRDEHTGLVTMENAPLAAFLSFLASVRNHGTRQNLALLFSSSTVCAAVSVDNVIKTREDTAADGSFDVNLANTTYRSRDLQVLDSVTSRGSVSLNMATASFIPLESLSMGAVGVIGDRFDEICGSPDFASKLTVPAYMFTETRERDGFVYEQVGGDPITGEGGTPVLVSAPRGQLLQDIEVFRRNAETIAGLFDATLGRGNMLSRVLTSSMLFNRLRSKVLYSTDLGALVELRRVISSFSPGPLHGAHGEADVPNAVDNIRSLLLEIAKSAGKSGAGHSRVSDLVQAMFTTSHLQHGGLSFPGADSSVTSEWLTLLNEFVQSMPDTVVPAKPVKGRTTKDSSVAVAAPGMIPIVVRYVTSKQDKTKVAFRTLCESIVKTDALNAYWRDVSIDAQVYIPPAYAEETLKEQGVDPLKIKQLLAGAQEAVKTSVEKLGGIDAIVDRCLDTMTWPDSAHTPLVARNLSVDYGPHELNNACAYTFSNGEGLWYVPLYGGDHACNNLLQIPAPRVKSGAKDQNAAFLAAAKAVNEALGVSLMLADTKRSAITSATAPAVPMVGVDVTWSSDAVPAMTGASFGEARVHVVINPAETGGNAYSQEAAHGMTICAGFGPTALRDSAKDPELRISKYHAIGTGDHLMFTKSASSVVSPDSVTDGGVHAPGSMARSYADYALGYRNDKSRRNSSDIVTDEDSYKVGPLTSALYQIVTGEPNSEGVYPSSTILKYIKDLIASGVKPESILEQQVRTVSRVTGKDVVSEAPVALSDVLDGLDVRVVEGLHPGEKNAVAFAISHRDDSLLALKVANIAHRASPHVGTIGKNYTLDAAAKAIEQVERMQQNLLAAEATAQNQALTTLTSCAILGSAVATDADSVAADLEREPRLALLKESGADPRGLEYRKLRAEIIAKRIRKSVLSPMSKIDAVLTACGATLAPDGTILDHTLCPMRRDVHTGSIVFDSSETGETGLYRGFKRRLADAEVNVQSLWFRYGMFLDPSLEGYAKLFGGLDSPEQIMDRMESIVTSIVTADAAYDRELRQYSDSVRVARKQKLRPPAEPDTLTAAKKVRNDLRKGFLSCFTDHHGRVMSERTYTATAGGRKLTYNAWHTMSFGDLMVSDNKGGSRFDRTAFRLGNDGVRRVIYDETGKNIVDESKGPMMYLAGTAFGAPRTPSYNGGAWLQFVRASFPFTETYKNGTWNVGSDAVVALDPATRDEILGCDNDGDESSLFLFAPTMQGHILCADVERCIPKMDNSWWNHTLASGSALESKANRHAMLSAACTPVDGVQYIRAKGEGKGFEFTAAGRRAVSNQMTSALLDMAHALEVPPGTGRRPFASEVSGRTKAQPFDDARWWKRSATEAPGFDSAITRLTDLMPPDIMKGGSVGDPALQEKVTLSAKKSSKARALIVSAASVLHTAYISGCFKGTLAKNRFALFGPEFGPDAWQAFMRHYDGLSNATFDDMKERICSRLGLTPEMIDTLVIDLLNSPRTPTTDREWYDTLSKYVTSVRNQLPDGTAVWAPSFDAEVPTEDKSRMFMAGACDEYDSTYHRIVTRTIFRGAKTYEDRKTQLLVTLGLRAYVGTDGHRYYEADSRVPENSARNAFAKWMMSNGKLVYSVVESALQKGGRNPVAGYLTWIMGSSCGSCSDAAAGVAGSIADLRTRLTALNPAFVSYMNRRAAWQSAKDFATAVNFAKVDPGSPTAHYTIAKGQRAYDEVMSERFDSLTEDRKALVISMRQATRMAHSCGLVNAGTPAARAYTAAVAVEEEPAAINADMKVKLSNLGEAEAAQYAGDIIRAVNLAADTPGLTVDSADKDALTNNITSVPYVITALQELPRTGYTSTLDKTEKFVRALAGRDSSPSTQIFGLRNTIESAFKVLYALSATSVEGLAHPGVTYLGTRNDSAFRTSKAANYRKGRTTRSDYGVNDLPLATIFPQFAVRDIASMRRMRDAIGEIARGTLDNATRENRYKAGSVRATSFVLNLETLSNMKKELTFAAKGGRGAKGTRVALSKAVDTVTDALARVAVALDVPPDKVAIKPSEVFTKLLPLYSAITEPVRGTPSYEQFSGSILAMLPGVYPTWSKRQADNDAAYDRLRASMPESDITQVGFVDTLSVLNFAPVNLSAVYEALRAAGVESGLATVEAGKLVAAMDPGRAVDPVRENPESRTLVDIFAHDGVLFKAAKLYDILGSMNKNTGGSTDTKGALAGTDTAVVTDTVPVDDPAPVMDKALYNMADDLREMLSAIPGLDITVDGNTMVVQGTISGEAALSRRGISEPVRTVLRVDLCPEGYGTGEGLDLNSPVTAASVTSSLREAKILDISARDFLERLSIEERRAIVSRFMPEALSESGAGYSLGSTPSWQLDSKGILTLAGAIRLRKTDSKTMYHEYFHSMISMMRALGMFTGNERSSLEKVFGKAQREHELFNEEKAADMFAAYVAKRREKSVKSKSKAAGFLQRMLDFLKRLLSVMTSRGFSYGETLKIDGVSVKGDEMLFNMVLSGQVLDSTESAKLVKTRLDAAHRVKTDLALNAAERLEGAMARRFDDPFSYGENLSAEELAKAKLACKRNAAELSSVPAELLAASVQTILAGRSATSATVDGGESAASTPVEIMPTTVEGVTEAIAGEMHRVIAPGSGITGESTAGAGRLSRVGHGIAQAIADGLDAVDPAVKGLLESNSDLSQLNFQTTVKGVVATAVYDVVGRGILEASETLGVNLRTRDAKLNNTIYANTIMLYDELASRLGYTGAKKNPIHEARQHKGDLVDRKRFVSSSDIAALLLTSGGLSYSDISRDAFATLAEIRDECQGHPGMMRNLAHFERNLHRITAKTSYKGDPIHEIRAGVTFGKTDINTGVTPDATEDKASMSRAALRNRRDYMFGDPRFQRALKTTMRTAYILSAAKKLYQILGIEESMLRGTTRIPGSALSRVRVVDRRTGKPFDAPVPASETADALGISVNDLLNDKQVFDPFAEVGTYINNPGEWLASTVRNTFGGKPLRELMTEHSKLEALTRKFSNIQNWWAMYLGENFVEGTKLLAVQEDKGHFVFDNGSVSYDEEGHERVGFDNYHFRALGADKLYRSTVDVTLDRRDKEVIDFWLKAAYFHAMHDKFMLTGIDDIFIMFDDISKPDGSRWQASDFAPDKVLGTYHDSHVGRMTSKLNIMFSQVLSGNQLPAFITDSEADGNYGLYDQLVEGTVETLNELQDLYTAPNAQVNPVDANKLFLEGMARRGLLRYTTDRKGRPSHGVVALSTDRIEKLWLKSDARAKLLKAGRKEELLTRDAVTKAAMSAYRECRDLMNENPWMVEGDGRHFNSFGSMMPFFAGNGVFMYYANRIGRDAKKDISQRLNQYEESFLETLNSAEKDATSAQMLLLSGVFDTGTDVGWDLRKAIAEGEYAAGTRKSLRSGLTIAPEDLQSMHKVAEIIYRRMCEIAWDQERYGEVIKRLGGKGSVARMLDFYETLAGEYTGWAATGMNATQMYEVNGVLPANFQVFHAVNVKIQEAARTAQFRNTFVGFLFSSDEQGAPIAYAKPSLMSKGYADDGIPEEVWEYAARWWAAVNGRKYDEAQSGRVNAARLYDEIITSNVSKTVNGRHFRQLDGKDRDGLVSVSDFAAIDDDARLDDVNSRNSINGGEAYGYAKMLFNTKRVVGGRAQSLLLDRIASYSKTLSVQHSMFFPIATKVESSAAAVGFWTMVASNFAPETARKLDGAVKNFDKVFHTHLGDTLNKDFIGFKDIIHMMDTNDPFLAEAINICTALGMSLSDRTVNPMEESKAQMENDLNRIADAARGVLGDSGAQYVKGLMNGFLFRGSERAFTYALNATKIATALQIAQVCKRKCRDEGRAFNLIREVKPYAAYLNAEVGGIDPMRYAWANPRFRRLVNWSLFSWEWTKGAWSAGGGEIIETALGGGHFTNPESRAFMWGRWLRMYGTIMIGVPVMAQALIRSIAWLLGGYDGDDDDSFWAFDNEEKHGPTAFNITPLLKVLAEYDTIRWLKDVPGVGALIPAYTGKDHYNTSMNRKYYMHFGKQGWEFFRWFSEPVEQFLAKLSMPVQRIMEGLLGYNPASREFDLPFSGMTFGERWLNPTTDGAMFNLLRAFVPFSWNALSTYGDAGVLPVLGPVSMGASYRGQLLEAQKVLTSWALNDREGYASGYARRGKNRALNIPRIAGILKDAELNGMDPRTILSEATGLAAKEMYKRLFELIPKQPGDDVDARALAKVARGLNRLGITQRTVMQSLKNKFGRRGMDWELMPKEQRIRVISTVAEAMRNPFGATEETIEGRVNRNLVRFGVTPSGRKDY